MGSSVTPDGYPTMAATIQPAPGYGNELDRRNNGVWTSPSRRLELAVHRIQRSRSLDALGRALAVGFSRVIRPGGLKDLLSGTWLGHPAHPILTDVPIGAWTSAFVLDVAGGETARDASDALIGFGVLAALPTALTGLSDLADVVKEERSVSTTVPSFGDRPPLRSRASRSG